MPKPALIEISQSLLPYHPAVKAWSELQPAQPNPTKIQVLKQEEKSTVYRLEGVGVGGTPVIAKRCIKETGTIERTIYEQVLPHVPVATLRYYGFTDEDGKYGWLFLEDGGRDRFSPLIEAQRTLAARWLGVMHTSSAHVAAAARLPDAGPSRYLAYLRSARGEILRNRANPVLNAGYIVGLEELCNLLDVIEKRWNQLERWCEEMPSTLVHGDFRPKNICVRTESTGTRLFPLDWETAGWGVPATDLAPIRGVPPGPLVDYTAYASTVRESWPFLDAATIERLVQVGRIFRQLAAISWASPSLAYKSFRLLWWAVDSLMVYREELSDAVSMAQWH